MKNWLELSESLRNTYGHEPENLLIGYINFIDKKKVLDLGVGIGRNSLFLSLLGCEVKGADISEHNIEKLTKEKNTLYFEHNDAYRHYYTKEEIVEYFKELELLTLKNAMVLDIDERGNHYHDIIEYIGRKSN